MDGATIFQMISGIGKSFGDSYDASRKQALSTDLGTKLKTGDYAGAADLALQGGDVQTGLALAKMGETRGASKQLGDTLGGLFGPGGPAADGPAAGTFGEMTQGGRRASGLPSFADTSGPAGDYVSKVFARESNGNPLAQASTSSARGLGQFTKGTWNAVAQQHPDLGLTPVGAGQDGRIDPDQMVRATRAHTADNEAILGRAGLPVTDATRYSLHLLGAGGGPRFVAGALQSPDAPATTLVRPEQVRANRNVFFNRDGSPKTAGAVMDDFARSFGGGSAAAQAPQPAARRIRIASADAGLSLHGANPLGVVPPEGASGVGSPALPGSRVASLPDISIGQPALHDGTAGGLPGPGAGGAPVGGGAPTLPGSSIALPRLAATAQLTRAGVPLQQAAGLARTAPGSPERVSALVRASLIPGLSEQQSGLVKTLLASELEGSKLTNDQKEYAVGLTQGFQGTLQDWKASQRPDRVKFIERNGEQYAVDPSNPSAEPQRINLPPNRRRIWGERSEDGQVIAAPPGIAPGTAGYYDADGTPQLLTGKGTNITTNIDNKGAGKFAEKANEFQAKRYGEMVEAADSAVSMRADIDTMAGLAQNFATGKLSGIRLGLGQYAKAAGMDDLAAKIAGDDIGSAEAFTAIADKLVPRMRVPGTGATSDAEGRSFRNSLPSLLKTPEGNAIIADTFRGLLDYQTAAGELASKALRGEISQAEADQALRALPSPYTRFKEFRGGARTAPGDAGGGTPAPKFDGLKTRIDMPDAQALRAAPDTPENRQTFDARYGEGAAQFVLRRPAPTGGPPTGGAPTDAAAGPKPIARGSSRVPLPAGVSTSQVMFEARKAIRDGRQRSAIEDKLRAYGLNPAELGD